MPNTIDARPNQKKSPAVGDWPEEVVKGQHYEAFLRKEGNEPHRYRPAASSGTFQALQEKKP